MAILKTENLKKYYGKDTTLVKALNGVDLEVGKGEFLSIVGTSARESLRSFICWEAWTALPAARYM